MSNSSTLKSFVRAQEFTWLLTRYDFEARTGYPLLSRIPSTECQKTIYLLSNLAEFNAVEVHRRWLVEKEQRRLESIPANAEYSDPRIRRWLYFKASTIDAFAPELIWEYTAPRTKRQLAAEYLRATDSNEWKRVEAFRARWPVLANVTDDEFRAAIGARPPQKRSLIDAVEFELPSNYRTKPVQLNSSDYSFAIMEVNGWSTSLDISFPDAGFDLCVTMLARKGKEFLTFSYESALGFGSSWDLWTVQSIAATAQLVREITNLYLIELPNWLRNR